MTAMTLDEVIDQLAAILDTSRRERARFGYFAALYLAVTTEVKGAIAAGRFDDGPRMAALIIAFANRYLIAYGQYQQGDPGTRVWQVAFDAGESSRYLVLQHLLLGMNAHINLDLGIVAAEIVSGPALSGLEHDFMAINQILAGMVDEVQNQIGEFSPWLGWLDYVGGRNDEAIVNFSMERARDSAWDFAQSLSRMNAEARAVAIDQRDRAFAAFASVIMRPGLTLGTIIFLIWLRECHDSVTIIEVLSRDSS